MSDKPNIPPADSLESLQERTQLIAQIEQFQHGGDLHKSVFMTLESWTGGDTFADGVRALIVDVKDMRSRLAKYEDAEGRPLSAVALPERFEMEPYQTVNKGSTNYKAGFNEALKEVARLNSPPVSTGGVDERAAFEAAYSGEYGTPLSVLRLLREGDAYIEKPQHSDRLNSSWWMWKQARAALSAPSHGEQGRDLPTFAQKVISKLKRFEECASDSDAGGVDIGRHWLDLLTQLGLLNRVQRSPGLWEISQQGEEVLAAAPSAGSQEQGE